MRWFNPLLAACKICIRNMQYSRRASAAALFSKFRYNKGMPAATPIPTLHIRPVDVRRDISAIADLIDVCFAPFMDADGQEYLRHLRRAAEDPSLQRWVDGPNERVSLPLSGYVWEENGRIVGNLSLIPFYRRGVWRTMIANVAVHPDFRRRKIARQLTLKALEHIREHRVPEAWLQVRVDNPAAQALYLSLGFQERSRRATWELYHNDAPMPSLALVEVNRRGSKDWLAQSAWLERIYPPEVAWNLGFAADNMAPSLWKTAWRWIENDILDHWRACKFDETLGFVTWEAPAHTAGAVWLAPNPTCEDEAMLALLAILRQYIPVRRPISLNYPAGLAASAFQQAGFTLLNTLIWMSVDII